MKTHCNEKTIEFQTKNSRKIIAHFNGGNISSDSGGLLLKQTEQITGIIRQFAGCFTDRCDANSIEHSVEESLAQRIYALALGYEELNDHDELRSDPLLAVLVGKDDRSGTNRVRSRDKAVNHHRVVHFFIKVFLGSYSQVPSVIVLELDATDDYHCGVDGSSAVVN